MSNPFAILMICWLVWVPACCFADEPASSDDTPDWQLSIALWRERVETARKRTEAFVADARARQENPAPSSDDQTSSIDHRIINDDNLQPGDIIATSKGFLVFMGHGESERALGDLQSIPETAPNAKAAGDNLRGSP